MKKENFRYPFECPKCGSIDTKCVWYHTIGEDDFGNLTDVYTNIITNEIVYDLAHTTDEYECNMCLTVYND